MEGRCKCMKARVTAAIIERVVCSSNSVNLWQLLSPELRWKMVMRSHFKRMIAISSPFVTSALPPETRSFTSTTNYNRCFVAQPVLFARYGCSIPIVVSSSHLICRIFQITHSAHNLCRYMYTFMLHEMISEPLCSEQF